MDEKNEQLKSLKQRLNMARQALNVLEIQASAYTEINIPSELKINLDLKRADVRDIEKKINVLETGSGTIEIAPPIPFANRFSEIKRITHYPPAYYLVDAPSGYGKTTLLRELEKRFRKEEWCCAYISVDADTKPDSIPQLISMELELNATSSSLDAKSLGEIIIREDSETKHGLVLLLDLEEKPTTDLLAELTGNFIPTMHDTLKNLSPLFPFCVVIAGQYIASREEIQRVDLPLSVISLSLFDYTTVKEFLKGRFVDVDDLAAHLFYLTGGHPECIMRISEVYRILEWKQEDLIKKRGESQIVLFPILHNKFQDICEEMPFKEWRNFIIKLSVFRRLDHTLLAHVMQKYEYEFVQNSISALADRLTATHLFNRQGRWIENDVIRRVCNLWLQYNHEEFEALCKDAKVLCEAGLNRPREREPEVWTIEYLFQCLQSSSKIIREFEQRKRIRHIFWDRDLPYILQQYLSPITMPEDIEYAKKCLIDKVKMDWEFQFMLNYYLREDRYTQQPYERLLQSIGDFVPGVSQYNDI